MTKRMKISGIVATLAIFVFLFLPLSARAERPDDILIIVNSRVKVDKPTLAELKQIFLKKRHSWKSGAKAIPINAAAGSPIRRAFLERVLGMYPDDELTYWQEENLKKGLEKPPSLKNNIKAVYKLKNSVSYCFREDYIAGVVKVVLTIPRSAQ